ncbi:MAG: hypothetical protein IKR73_06525 [Oscillospiraceae bacterium]|nr:hypothetical protein [Oscillospiraceae bacterium]
MKKHIMGIAALSLAAVMLGAPAVSAEWEQTDEGYRQIGEDGSPRGKGWYTENGKRYLIGEDGYTLHGAVKVNGKLYYLRDDDEGSVYYGLKRMGGKLYYFRAADKGAAASGWAEIKDRRYYFNKDHHAVTGLVRIGDDRYIFDEKGVMQTGLVYIDELVYDLGEDGKLKSSYEGDEKAEPVITWDMDEAKVKELYDGCLSFKQNSMLIVKTDKGLRYFVFDKDSGELYARGVDSPLADKTEEFKEILEAEGYTLIKSTDMHEYATLIFAKDGEYAAAAGNGKSSIMLYASPLLSDVFEAGGTEALIALAAENGLSID